MNDDKSNNTADDDKETSSETEAAFGRDSVPEKKPSNVHPDEHTRNDVVARDEVAKVQSRSHVAAKPGAFSASEISSGESINPQMRKFETDILIKQRAGASRASSLEQDVEAKQKMPSSSTERAKPGAYSTSAVSTSNSIKNVVQNAEADIMAKQMANASKNVVSTLEKDIAAKQQGRRSNEAPSKPGAFNHDIIPLNSNVNPVLRNIEADIEAKQRAGASHPNATTTTPGAHSSVRTNAISSMRDLESHISAKMSNMTARQSGGMLEEKDNKMTQQNLKADVADRKTTTGDLTSTPARIIPDSAVKKPNNENGEVNGNSAKYDNQSKGISSLNDVDVDGKNVKKDEQNQSALQQGTLNDLEYGEYGANGAEGLAVAFAVEEVDTNTYLPSAVEFDPDAKPSMYRNRRFRLYVWLLLVAALVGTIGAVLGIVFTAEEPTPDSVPYRATIGIRENLERIVSSEKLDDYTSPYRKALDWIMFTDPMVPTPDSYQFFNRYMMAYLYYATSQKKPWTSDCAPSEFKKENCIDVFVSDVVEGIVVNRTSFRWFSNTDECEWAGIYCDGFNQIRVIELGGVGMSGTFPEGLSLLPYLEEIDFRYNELDGTLPAHIANMKSLVDVGLEHCAFTGSIPDLWFESRSWISLKIVGSQIAGTLSSNISKLEDMLDLELTKSTLTGTLAPEIGNMANLRFLELDSNQFQGPLPGEFGKLSNLIVMDLSRNLITGTIPEDISGCTTLIDLFLFGNLLTGPLPQSFWDMTNLTYIRLGGNTLTGAISNRLSEFSDLRELEIENNQFNGSFPFRFGKTDIRIIRAYGNKFDGNVSTELCKLFDKGNLLHLEFDCASPLGGDTPEIFCPDDCCTVCCNPDGEDCVDL